MPRGTVSKLKGYSRTFVVCSNSSAHAANSGNAVLLGRNIKSGPFFKFSETVIPPEPLNTVSTPLVVSPETKLAAEFKGDWADFLYRTALPACGVKVRERNLEKTQCVISTLLAGEFL